MPDPTLVGLCGALRADSSNRKLMFEAARLFTPDSFSELDLRFPLFDQDIHFGTNVFERFGDTLLLLCKFFRIVLDNRKGLPVGNQEPGH